MGSWRIQSNIIDKSGVAIPQNGTVGAMVIRASKGTGTPIYLQAGNTNRIIDLFGSPSASYPDVWEAIQYNNNSPMWIAAPSPSTDLYGGALVSSVGSIALSTGVQASAFGTYSFPTPSVSVTNQAIVVGKGDGTTTTFTYTLSNMPATVSTATFKLFKGTYSGGTDQTITVGTATGGVYPLSGGPLSGTLSSYNTNNRLLTLVFTTAPSTSDAYYVTYSVTATCYLLLLAKSPYADDLGIKSSYNFSSGLFTVVLNKLINGSWITLNTYVFSLVQGAKDGFGKSAYIGDVLANDDYIQYLINSSVTSVGTFNNDLSNVAFAGGSRTTTTTALLVSSWQLFESSKTYPAKYFMSTVDDSTVVQEFVNLRNNYQKYSQYILPLSQTDTVAQAITKVNTTYATNNRGLRFYWNYLKMNTIYGTFWTSMVGRIGAKHAAMNNVYFALAPCWIDENGHGGLLGPGAIASAFDPSEIDLQNLDSNCVNAITIDPQNGPMIMSQRTAQSANILSDTSWIGHSDLIDYIFQNIESNVLTYQVCKINDDSHRQLALGKANMLTKGIVDSGILEGCQHKCDSGNNTATTMSQRKFILTTAIQVTPFSEQVVYNIIATPQGTTVQQVLQ